LLKLPIKLPYDDDGSGGGGGDSKEVQISDILCTTARHGKENICLFVSNKVDI